jgi:hypothetical protein
MCGRNVSLWLLLILDADPFVQAPKEKAPLGPCNNARSTNQLVRSPLYPTQPHAVPLDSLSRCTSSLPQTWICTEGANDRNGEHGRHTVSPCVYEAREARLCAGGNADEECSHERGKEEG